MSLERRRGKKQTILIRKLRRNQATLEKMGCYQLNKKMNGISARMLLREEILRIGDSELHIERIKGWERLRAGGEGHDRG